MNKQKSDRPSRSSQPIADGGRHTGSRRRGEILEAAILQAAWDELTDVGYTQLTVERVAARAKTNKAVVYRRWVNKAELILAALRKHLPRPANDVPNTGDLRKDVLILLRRIAQPLQMLGAQTIHGLMVEYLDKKLISSIPQIMRPGAENKFTATMITILKNAELRGEVNLKKISPRIISLPLDLLRYEILVTHEPISDKSINEIVDDIFMPLIHA